MPIADKTILKGLRSGKLKHFETIYYLYNKWVYNFVFAILKDRMVAQDITQDVFLQVWNKRANIDVDANFEGYLFTIARNLVYHYVQHELRRQSYEKRIGKQAENMVSVSDEQETDNRLMEDCIMEVSQKLPDMRRQILMLYWKSGLTYKEIAEVLSISESTVATQIQRSLKFIRSKID